jgi:hypothetical protein
VNRGGARRRAAACAVVLAGAAIATSCKKSPEAASAPDAGTAKDGAADASSTSARADDASTSDDAAADVGVAACAESRHVRFLFARLAYQWGSRPLQRMATIYAGVEVSGPGAKATKRIYLPRCPKEDASQWPACRDYVACSSTPLTGEQSPGGVVRGAIACTGKKAATFALVEREGRLVVLSREEGAPTWVDEKLGDLEARCVEIDAPKPTDRIVDEGIP